MRFASLLADNLNYSSIKVYLSAVCSLHIDHGLPDPLVNCLRSQHLLRGIKRVRVQHHPGASQSQWIFCRPFSAVWICLLETI